MSSKATAILSGILVVQGLVLAAMVFTRPIHWQAPEVQLPAPDSLAVVTLQHVRPPDGGFTEQVERPLFVAGRRPITAEAVQDVDESTKDLQLLGLFGPDGGGGAIVSLAGNVRRVAIGARLGALTLTRIDRLDAVFWDGAAERVLRLKPLPRAGALAATATATSPANARLQKRPLQQAVGAPLPPANGEDGAQ